MIKGQRILIRSRSGLGKTTLVGFTLPGKTIIWETDLSGSDALVGHGPDVTVVQVPPDFLPINEEPRSQKDIRPDLYPVDFKQPQAWYWFKRQFDAFCADRPREGFHHWSQFDNIVLDTVTGLNQMVAVGTLWRAKRTTINIKGADIPMFMGPVRAVIENLSALALAENNPNIIYLGHEYLEAPWDAFNFGEGTNQKKRNPEKTEYRLTIQAFGQMREDIFKAVGHSFRLVVYGSGGSLQYKLQTTTPAPHIFGIKTPWRFLPDEFDVTIKDWAHPTRYGLGAILALAEKELL